MLGGNYNNIDKLIQEHFGRNSIIINIDLLTETQIKVVLFDSNYDLRKLRGKTGMICY